jgi:murein DD-endopeptidase MepM/ murein hydrolase activator NlpD
VRLRPILPVLVATLLALSLPSPATAGSGGGAAAPTGNQAGGGGAHYGGAVPAARRQSKHRPARRKPARRQPPVLEAPALPAGDHVFPVAGAYDLGGDDARFGAPRSGHTHQGQDIAAVRGTAVVAPYAGVVDWVRYQRGGAGHYVVLDADDDRDYVFMHLRRGSIRVVAGQRVAAGDQIGEVGNSGRSFGAHLHLEVWVGGWFEKGGEPVDPLPLLEAWSSR